jgi:pullulanase
MYDYYKGLIALRKAHSSFRMTETQDVIDSLDFIYTDVAGMIAFEVDNLISGDTAESILVFHNSNKAEVNITLAEGATYYLVVNEEFAGTETLETFTSGQTISIAANSTYVILVDYDNR